MIKNLVDMYIYIHIGSYFPVIYGIFESAINKDPYLTSHSHGIPTVRVLIAHIFEPQRAVSVMLEVKETDEPKGSTGNAGRNVV